MSWARNDLGMAAIEPAFVAEAVELTRAAGELTLGWFRRPDLDVEHKADGTPVTAADRAAERFLRAELASRYPDDSVIGEEEPDTTGSSGRVWIIDPIDGTKAFSRGVPLFANLLAVYDDEGPAVGVVNIPALGETVWAGRGLGCSFNDRPTRVSSVSELSSSCVCTSGLDGWSADALDALCSAGPLVRTWGDGYGFVLVATGRAEAMVDPNVSLWDIAPMPVIMAEAGGVFTDLAENASIELEPSRSVSGVASNGLIHTELLEVMNDTSRHG